MKIIFLLLDSAFNILFYRVLNLRKADRDNLLPVKALNTLLWIYLISTLSNIRSVLVCCS